MVGSTLGQPPVGLITDVDGTISPIAPTPELARVSPSIRELLRALTRKLRLVAAVSGRSAADVRAMVGVPEMIYVGNHGLERWSAGHVSVDPNSAPYLPAISSTLAELRRRLDLEGLRFEDKGATGSVHYRLASDQESARAAILTALKATGAARDLRVTEGRLVVELRPPLSVHKGVAVARLLDDYALSSAVYLGDDRTDLDAFRAIRVHREHSPGFLGLTVGVLSPEAPEALAAEAGLVVDGVLEVERLLRWLVDQA